MSLAAQCARRGTSAVAPDVGVLAGPAARRPLSGREGPCSSTVWASRRLLHGWDEGALPALMARHHSWGVRETAAKVIGRPLVGDALAELARLKDEPVRRVARAAERALTALVSEGLSGW